ncbi:MAG: hypothetical protein JWQ72_3046 [Polaromonas sp.]|nr:hypothetical protein [Polaromonas sp.]
MFSELPLQQKRFIKTWVAVIAVIFLLLGWLSVYIISQEKQSSAINHVLRMDAAAVEPGKTPPDPLPTGTDFTPVNIGIYLDGIETVSVKDSFWTATFYVWFRWKGDKSLDPGKTFQLVDAKVEKKELLDNYVGADGMNYQNYKVVAKMTKFFNTTRVPLDDHMLNIYVEDGTNDVSRLRYVADTATNISSRVKVPGYSITGIGSVVKPHTYKTTYGDPRSAEGKRTTYSEYTFAVSIKRASMGVYLKLFIGLFAGVILTLGSFFIRPSDTGPRFGLPSAAYFGAVANTYMVSSLMPSTGQFGLADLVTGIGLFTISLCVVATLASGYYYLRKDEKEFSRHLDRASWVVIFIGYVAVNIVLPFVAFS